MEKGDFLSCCDVGDGGEESLVNVAFFGCCIIGDGGEEDLEKSAGMVCC